MSALEFHGLDIFLTGPCHSGYWCWVSNSPGGTVDMTFSECNFSFLLVQHPLMQIFWSLYPRFEIFYVLRPYSMDLICFISIVIPSWIFFWIKSNFPIYSKFSETLHIFGNHSNFLFSSHVTTVYRLPLKYNISSHGEIF